MYVLVHYCRPLRLFTDVGAIAAVLSGMESAPLFTS